jgi:hypothetical protein
MEIDGLLHNFVLLPGMMWHFSFYIVYMSGQGKFYLSLGTSRKIYEPDFLLFCGYMF